MASSEHYATLEDDERHTPGPGALPLWNESFWFPFYDPQQEIGVVLRVGLQPNRGWANLYLFITHHGEVVHSAIDQRIPLPPSERRRVRVRGLEMIWDPRERFTLHYNQGAHGFDVVWQGHGPTYKYPAPPDASAEEYPRHIEHAGVVTGTVTIGGTPYRIECAGHRDHSWGGERDWAKFYNWDYLSGELGTSFWFHAVRIKLSPDMDYINIGCLWDGKEMHSLDNINIATHTTDGGTRQLGVELRATDEQGRAYRILGGNVLVNCPVVFGRTWLKDAIVHYQCGDMRGYGIHELGYVETDPS